MAKRGLREIRTISSTKGRRQAWTPQGAYSDLACLALHKERLLRERRAFEKRNQEIDRRIAEMDHQLAVLRRFVETEDARVLEELLPAKGNRETESGDVRIKEREMTY